MLWQWNWLQRSPAVSGVDPLVIGLWECPVSAQVGSGVAKDNHDFLITLKVFQYLRWTFSPRQGKILLLVELRCFRLQPVTKVMSPLDLQIIMTQTSVSQAHKDSDFDYGFFFFPPTCLWTWPGWLMDLGPWLPPDFSCLPQEAISFRLLNDSLVISATGKLPSLRQLLLFLCLFT